MNPEPGTGTGTRTGTRTGTGTTAATPGRGHESVRPLTWLPVSQLSFFSADLTPPRVEDLGGLLAAHGQISRSESGSRLSILVADEWRAKALLREFRVRDIEGRHMPADQARAGGLLEELDSLVEGGSAPAEQGGPTEVLIRTDRSAALDFLAADWTKGAVKSAPPGLVAGAGLLRCWTIAAGRRDESGFLLGLDRHAPDTFEPLGSVCARAGIAATFIGARGGGPALRVVGHRRSMRLVELLGTPPPEAPAGAFPLPEH